MAGYISKPISLRNRIPIIGKPLASFSSLGDMTPVSSGEYCLEKELHHDIAKAIFDSLHRDAVIESQYWFYTKVDHYSQLPHPRHYRRQPETRRNRKSRPSNGTNVCCNNPLIKHERNNDKKLQSDGNQTNRIQHRPRTIVEPFDDGGLIKLENLRTRNSAADSENKKSPADRKVESDIARLKRPSFLSWWICWVGTMMLKEKPAPREAMMIMLSKNLMNHSTTGSPQSYGGEDAELVLPISLKYQKLSTDV